MPVKTRQQPLDNFESVVSDLLSDQTKRGRKVTSNAARLTRALSLHVSGLVEKSVTKMVQTSVKAFIEELVSERRMPSPWIDWTKLRQAGGGVEKAQKEGTRYKQKVWSSREMLTSDEAGKRIGITREALNNRRTSGQALALEAGKRGYRYPSCQFEDQLIPTMPELLKTLAHLDPWAQYLFFKQPEPLLDGETPLKLLREGKAGDVIRVARLLAAEV